MQDSLAAANRPHCGPNKPRTLRRGRLSLMLLILHTELLSIHMPGPMIRLA